MKARQRLWLGDRLTSPASNSLPHPVRSHQPTTPTRTQAMASAAVEDNQPDGLAVPGDRIGRVSSHQAGPGKSRWGGAVEGEGREGGEAI